MLRILPINKYSIEPTDEHVGSEEAQLCAAALNNLIRNDLHRIISTRKYATDRSCWTLFLPKGVYTSNAVPNQILEEQNFGSWVCGS